MSRNNRHRHQNSPKGAHSTPRPRPEGEVELDFNPRSQLDKVLRSRPLQEGITIDPAGTYIIDDGLWVREHNKDGWHITASIADLPSMIPHGSHLETTARTRMEEDVTGRGPVRRIWPVGFIEKYVSLRAFENQAARPAITFTIILDKNMDVQHCKIRRTAFVNQGQHTDGSFHGYKDFTPQMALQWQRLARGLYQKRCRELGHQFDSYIVPGAELPSTRLTKDHGNMKDGNLLVHEVMRLTNRLATDYFREHDLTVPFKNQKASIRATLVSPRHEFDMATNRMCIKLLEHMLENELPYVHLNSPMRKYGDYLAMKVLGAHLSGRPQYPEIRDEITDLSSVFNRHATRVPDFLLQQRWKSEWQGQLRHQMPWHPHPIPGQHQGYNLVKACKEMQLGAPLVAEREIMVQGTVLYFTSMQVEDERMRSWAVSHNAEQAMERAAGRMNAIMKHRGRGPKAE